MSDLAEQVKRLWEGRDDIAAVMPKSEARAVVHEAIDLLDRGEARVAEISGGEVIVVYVSYRVALPAGAPIWRPA